MKKRIKKRYIKLLTKVEFLVIDIAGLFNRIQVKLKAHRWRIEGN